MLSSLTPARANHHVRVKSVLSCPLRGGRTRAEGGTAVLLSPSTTPALDEEMGENLDQIGPTERPEVRFRSLVQFLVVKISCTSDEEALVRETTVRASEAWGLVGRWSRAPIRVCVNRKYQCPYWQAWRSLALLSKMTEGSYARLLSPRPPFGPCVAGGVDISEL